MIIADKFEHRLNQDGQNYEVVFEGNIGDSPRRCEVFHAGSKIGEATWYDNDGLIDRFPEHHMNPPRYWDRLCNEVERAYEFMLRGNTAALRTPWFITSDGYTLHYERGVWTDGDMTFSAATVSGHPLEDQGQNLEGTYYSTKPVWQT